MRTEEAVTEAEGIWFAFAGVLLLYAGAGHDRDPRPALDVAALARARTEDVRDALRPAPEAVTMTRADAAAVILWTGATLYAVFGGADFGAGLWDLIAGDAERGARPRALIQRSLTPVWEANHVWLIFILVVLWTAFPEAFGAVMSTLYVPLALAAVGIVLRGAGFAFRKSIESLQARRAMGAAFAISSVLTPFFMGTVVGAVAAGNVPADGNGDAFSSWIAPLPLLVGALFVASGAYLAAVFLIADARASAGDAARSSATSPAAPWSPRSSPGRWRSPGSSPSTTKPATSTTASPTRRCRW